MKALLDLLFPPRCVACRRRGSWLCPTCRGSMPRLPPERCHRCAEPLVGALTCPRCWAEPPDFRGLTCAFAFAGTARLAIHRLKYQRQRHLAEPLAAALLEADASGTAGLAAHLPPDAMLVPIPLHPRRMAERGYNQSALLAQALGRQLRLTVAADALARVRDTPPQVGLTHEGRRTNVRGAFAASDAVAGRAILLVDDVCTTTSTLREAAAVLRRAGAASIDAIVFARAYHGQSDRPSAP